MNSFVDLPVVVLDKAFTAEATEEAVLLVMLPFMTVSVTFQVESFATEGAHEGEFLIFTNPMRGGEMSYQVGCVVIYRVNNLLADLTDTHGPPWVRQVLDKVLPDRASLLPSLFGLFGLQLSVALGLLILRGG